METQEKYTIKKRVVTYQEVTVAPFMKSEDGNQFYRITGNEKGDRIAFYPVINEAAFSTNADINESITESTEQEWNEAMQKLIEKYLKK